MSGCDLCAAEVELTVYAVPESAGHTDADISCCSTCLKQIEQNDELDVSHWRCLNDSMWSQMPAVQIMAWRMLNRLQSESWAQDLLEMLYLDDDLLAWATAADSEDEDDVLTKDSNGAVLEKGDTITIIKDLDVKGVSFVAKRGTTVKNIALTSNPEHIEGRVNGTRIVILTKFVKKSG